MVLQQGTGRSGTKWKEKAATVSSVGCQRNGWGLCGMTMVWLDLPALPLVIFVVILLTSILNKALSIATGCSFWQYLPQVKQVHGAPQERCMRGLLHPLWPHLIWTCDATRSLSTGVVRPSNRPEERLWVRVLPPSPGPPIDADFASSVSLLARLVEQASGYRFLRY